jgi:hypothetical protein
MSNINYRYFIIDNNGEVGYVYSPVVISELDNVIDMMQDFDPKLSVEIIDMTNLIKFTFSNESKREMFKMEIRLKYGF